MTDKTGMEPSMKTRTMAFIMSAMMVLGIGAVATPASATVDVCQGFERWISAGALGEVQVCFNASYYSPVTLQVPMDSSSHPFFFVAVHDWTNDGISIYVQD